MEAYLLRVTSLVVSRIGSPYLVVFVRCED